MNERIKELKLKGKKNFQFINLDLLDSKKTYNLLGKNLNLTLYSILHVSHQRPCE